MATGTIPIMGNVKNYCYYKNAAATFEHNFSDYCQFIVIANIVNATHNRSNGMWYGVTAANDNQCNVIEIQADTSSPTSVVCTSTKLTITTQQPYVRVSVIEIPFS